MNLAFRITNALLDMGVIVEGVSAAVVQNKVADILAADPRMREAIIHLQDERWDTPMPVCGQWRQTEVTDDPRVVNCLKCLKHIRRARS